MQPGLCSERLFAQQARSPFQKLVDAVQQEDTEQVLSLLRKGVKPNNVKYFDNQSTLLHIAVLVGNPKIVSALLLNGGVEIINKQDSSGFTPLDEAVRSRNRGVTRTLLSANAEVSLLTHRLAFEHHFNKTLDALITESLKFRHLDESEYHEAPLLGR